MEMMAKHPSGAEEWHCPTCGRRFLLQWPPAYKKIVLEPGDEYAAHSCSKGGLMIGAATVRNQADDESTADSGPADDAEQLKPWMRWLKDANLDEHLGDDK